MLQHSIQQCLSAEISRMVIQQTQYSIVQWYTHSPTVPAGEADVGSVVGITVHITWEGSGLHLPLSTHTELDTDGVNPG